MITLKKLQWDNCFSYGAGNSLDLDDCTLTQLVGTNGQGKSSIPLILEEVLFNKNSKGIKKAEIQNRFINKGYHINLTFDVDENNYEIDINRKGSIKCKLYENGKDISSHTATNTYKTVQNLLGLDFKTFTQLVYQNTNMSLQFLTATDTNRKKFLIELLKLDEYVEFFEIFKVAARDIQIKINRLDSKSDTIVKWLDENKLDTINILEIKNLPNYSEDDEKQLRQLRNDLEKISEKNKKIIDNNYYKDELDRLENLPERLYVGSLIDLDAKSEMLGTLNANLLNAEAHLDKLRDLKGICPTCEQDIDEAFKAKAIAQRTEQSKELADGLKKLSSEMIKVTDKIKEYKDIAKLVRENEVSIAQLNTSINELEKFNVKLHTELEQYKKDGVEESDIEKLESLKVDIEKVGEQKTKLKEDKVYHEAARSMLMDTGIKTKIIKQYLPIMNKLINKYLTSMEFYVNFTLDENFEETIKSRYRDEFTYASFSEGEKMRIDLALLFTWRAIAKMKNSTNTNLLILDEIFDSSLDGTGTDEFLKILNTLSGENIFVISHKQDALVDKFRSTIKFEKIRNFSHVTT